MKFSSSTAKRLGHYVYALVDPRSDEIFYVGKASANNRAFNHLAAAPSEHAKSLRIQEIRSSSLQPRVEILRYGLASVEACFDVEAAIIDALGLENLTNKVRGHGVDRGRQTAAEVERLHGSRPMRVEDIPERLMLFFIGKTYSPTKTEAELYDCTRQFWSGVSEKTRTALPGTRKLPYPLALAVVDSVVVRVYSVAAWFPGGTTLSTREPPRTGKRWEFVGQVLPDHYLAGHKLTRNSKDLPANQQGYGYIGSGNEA